MAKCNLMLSVDIDIMKKIEDAGLKGELSKIFEKAIKDHPLTDKDGEPNKPACMNCGQSIYDENPITLPFDDEYKYICRPCWRTDAIEIYKKWEDLCLKCGVLPIKTK